MSTIRNFKNLQNIRRALELLRNKITCIWSCVCQKEACTVGQNMLFELLLVAGFQKLQ